MASNAIMFVFGATCSYATLTSSKLQGLLFGTNNGTGPTETNSRPAASTRDEHSLMDSDILGGGDTDESSEETTTPPVPKQATVAVIGESLLSGRMASGNASKAFSSKVDLKQKKTKAAPLLEPQPSMLRSTSHSFAYSGNVQEQAKAYNEEKTRAGTKRKIQEASTLRILHIRCLHQIRVL